MAEPQGLPRQPGEIPGQTLWIIWLAIFGSIFLYLLIGIVARQQGMAAQMEENIALIRWVLTAVAIGETGLVIFLPVFSKSVTAFGTLCIIRWALTEAIAIYGMVLYFLGDDVWVLLFFCAWAAIQMGLLAPTKSARERSRARRTATTEKSNP